MYSWGCKGRDLIGGGISFPVKNISGLCRFCLKRNSELPHANNVDPDETARLCHILHAIK